MRKRVVVLPSLGALDCLPVLRVSFRLQGPVGLLVPLVGLLKLLHFRLQLRVTRHTLVALHLQVRDDDAVLFCLTLPLSINLLRGRVKQKKNSVIISDLKTQCDKGMARQKESEAEVKKLQETHERNQKTKRALKETLKTKCREAIKSSEAGKHNDALYS